MRIYFFRKQRRKAIERKAELRRKMTEKKEFLKHQEVFRIKSIKKELKVNTSPILNVTNFYEMDFKGSIF